MSVFSDKLSAFLDGELPENEARAIEAALAVDPALQAELEVLMAVEEAVQTEFADMLVDPVPVELASAIKNAPKNTPANLPDAPSGTSWLATAAALVMLTIGGIGGYLAGSSQSVEIAAAPGWLADIADYHRVYSGQKRHLVEVGAEEAEHIQTWLTAEVGADVRVPDLSAHGLTFRGARLLVAAGKPVSQLMFTDEQGRVVALCQIRTDTPQANPTTQSIDAFTLVSWGGDGANFVVVGDDGHSDLEAIAATAGAQV